MTAADLTGLHTLPQNEFVRWGVVWLYAIKQVSAVAHQAQQWHFLFALIKLCKVASLH